MQAPFPSLKPHHWVLATLLLLVAAGCVNSPRNGEKMPARGGHYQLTGLTSQPNSFVTMRVKNQRTGAWANPGQGVTSGTSASTDAVGMKWYAYNERRTISNDVDHWRRAPSVGSQRRVSSDLRFIDATDGELHTFDTNADACGERFRSQGLLGVMNNCQSSNSPTATVFADCGKANQDCCIANDITAANRCDDGRLCGSSNRCTIPSGGRDQPCDGDDGCGASTLTCITGMCRDRTIESLPLATLDLRVTTCNDSSWNKQNSGSRLTVNLGTDDFQIEVPGTELRNNTVDTFGLSPMDVTTLGDIRQLELEIYNRDWCVSKVELIANGSDVVFSKSYSSPVHLLGTYPQHMRDWLTIPRDELRTFWTTRDSAPFCDAPAQMSGAAIERKIAGMIGQVLLNSDDFTGDFDQGGGFVRFRRVDATTARLSARAHVSKVVNGIGNVGVDVEFSFTLGFVCTGSTVALNMSKITVDDLDGNFAYDVLNIASIGFLDEVGISVAEVLVNNATGSIRESLEALVEDLPFCPPLALDTAAPPNLNITLPIPAGAINICL